MTTPTPISFRDLELPSKISQALQDLKYETPTPIQAQTIPMLMQEPTDFLGIAATGTGKTAAYGIPLLSRLKPSGRYTEAIILAPTRELAKQITDNLKQMGKNLDISVLPIYGGAGYREQIFGLKRGANVVVATPGRLVDHIQQGTIDLTRVKTVVLDEADEMISMGFTEDMESILKAVQANDAEKKVNSWLFSATMQPDLRKIADRYLKQPKVVTINPTQMLSGTVEQIYYTLREEQKVEAVCRILDITDDFHGLIFCQTKTLVDEIDSILRDRGYASDQLHGDRSQSERERTLDRFKRKLVRVLVCTDVAARGLDVKNLSHVINFSIPRELDSYVHRIGRTGRSGKPGIAISLVTPSHIGLIRKIEALTRSQLRKGSIPSAHDVNLAKLRKMVSAFVDVEVNEATQKLVEQIWNDELEAMAGPEMLARLVSMLHPEVSRTDEQPLGIEISDRGGRNHGRREDRFGGRPGGRSRERHRPAARDSRGSHRGGSTDRRDGEGRRRSPPPGRGRAPWHGHANH